MLTAALLALATAVPPDLTAVGIIVSPRPESSVAILRAGGRSRVVVTGEAVFGGRVVLIGPASVVLEFEDGRRVLRLAAGAPAAHALARTPAPSAEPLNDGDGEAA